MRFRRLHPGAPNSLRLRLTITSCLVIALAATGGAAAMISLQRRQLISGVDTAARTQANNVAALAGQGPLPATLAVLAGDLDIVQVVDDHGNVVAASTNITGEPRIASFPPSGPGNGRGAGHAARTVRAPVGSGSNFRMVAVSAQGPAGNLVVYAGGSLGPVEDSIRATTWALLLGLPLLVLLVGALIWRTVGRALAPVEAIRSQVATLSGTNLHQRVPEPARNDEIARLARTMNLLLGRLETASDRQKRFVADAAHELLSPLALARAELEVALTHPDTQHWRTSAATTLTVCNEMEQLVRDLLFLARADEGQLSRPADLVDLAAVVKTSVDSLELRPGIAIELHGAEHAIVTGDAGQIRRLARNLLDNAARHARSQVAVTLGSENGNVTLDVSDDGPGIPPADRESVFERFTRLDPARNRTDSGAGLGLAIARTIARRHGGDLHVDEPAELPGAHLIAQIPSATGDTPRPASSRS